MVAYPDIAVMPDVQLAVGDALTENGAWSAPAATTIEAGAVNEGFDEAKVTVKPPVGAGPLKQTVPVAVQPADMVGGLRYTLETD
jgi:hypothetical protein